MRHIKTYENIDKKIPKKGVWIVAYRPKTDYDENIININGTESVIDYGKIIDDLDINKNGTHYYGVIFKNSGKYMRIDKHILYVAENEEDSKEKVEMLKTINKYNL